MANSKREFDPYHKWLGIPAHEQPPNHYRLLRISLFESDAEVIENAYDKEMQALKEQEHGQHVDLLESISRELIAARNCLHDADRKGTYDGELREGLKAEESGEQYTVEQAQRTAIDEAVRAAPSSSSMRGNSFEHSPSKHLHASVKHYWKFDGCAASSNNSMVTKSKRRGG